ncbi:MAG: U32 family peptidase [Ruminococcus sp.]|nr:U32 family peptidase [Ruminococcus sp.]
MNIPEILAPAGSMETLHAALRSGADAVYVGGKKFSARSSAANFSEAELAEAATICHKYGAKIYLAVNTIICDDEADEFCRYIKSAASSGIDAFIVQDWGCAGLIRRCVPDAVLHASTQMSVHTVSGARMLGRLGFTRVVPARELDKETLRRICALDIETEVFVHGALCMSMSGQCYMSAIIGSRSANRGCCGQACRLPFSADGKADFAALSLKDLSLLPKSNELTEIGVDSFKIEGRMKRPEYVASAVNELKKSLDGSSPDMQLLKGIFSRSGFTDGYFTGVRQNMFGIREKEDVTAAHSLIPKIHELYRNERAVHELDFHVKIKENIPVTVTAVCGDVSVTVQGNPPEKAMNRPTDTEMLEKQFSRLGGTVFSMKQLTADIDCGLIVPAGRLNELRRELTDKLSELIIRKNTPSLCVTDFTPVLPMAKPRKSTETLPLRTYCRTTAQVEAALDLSEYVIVPIELTDKLPLNNISAEKLIISPPRFISDEERLISRLSELKKLGLNHLFCHTPDCIEIGRQLGFRLHGSFSLNVFNSYSADFLKNLGLEDCIVSFEAKLEQISAIKSELSLGAVTYGRLPLMLTHNCPVKNELGCGKCTGHLIDRTGRSLPVACSADYVEILNSDCLFMADRINEFNNTDFGVIMLSDENDEQTRLALRGVKPHGNITRGLYYRGI